MKPLLITIMGKLLLRRLASFSLLLFPLLFELNETEWWKRAKASRLQQQQQQPTVSQLFTERGVPGCGESGVRELKAGVLPFRCTDLWQSWLGDTVPFGLLAWPFSANLSACPSFKNPFAL